MHSHHAGDHVCIILQSMLNEPCIFHNRFLCFVHSVPVGNFIAQTASNSQFFCRFFYNKETVRNAAEAGMVVEYRRHTVFNAVNVGSPGAL